MPETSGHIRHGGTKGYTYEEATLIAGAMRNVFGRDFKIKVEKDHIAKNGYLVTVAPKK